MPVESVGTPVLWIGFIAFIIVMLALDLGVFNRRAHVIHFREALGWSIFWIALALLFNVGVYYWIGPRQGLEFFTAYIIEKSLSVDNLFVFLVIFSFFKVEGSQQHRVLFWGILGALVMRAIFIFAGTALIHRFDWAIYFFGAILLLTGAKLLFQGEEDLHPERNPLIRMLSRVLPITTANPGGHFWIREKGKLMFTTLFLALLTVEISDVLFAVDSIPAVLGISTDPFIVFTSNIFAILGLRSLYFLLADMIGRFRFLHFGLAAVLLFIGGKMIVSAWYELPILWSLGTVGALLGLSIVASLVIKPRH